jgi:hypothetical protein
VKLKSAALSVGTKAVLLELLDVVKLGTVVGKR